jgi:hypothetical protein
MLIFETDSGLSRVTKIVQVQAVRQPLFSVATTDQICLSICTYSRHMKVSQFVTPVTILLDFSLSPTILCSYFIIMDSKKHSFVNKVKNMIKPGASSGFFKRAKNVTITGGNFNEVHGDVCLTEFVHCLFSC